MVPSQRFHKPYIRLMMCCLSLPFYLQKFSIFYVHQKYTSEKKSCLETNGKVQKLGNR
jgi:hypothetical protein